MSDRRDSELDLKAIVGFAAGLLLTIAVSSVLLWYFSKSLRGLEEAKDPAPPALAAARAPYQPPGPRLQSDPASEMEDLRRGEDAILHTYGWVDQAGGIARIPIARAIALMADDGGGAAAATSAPEAAEVDP
ncbi:MAG: hypothetical protein O7A04_11620 [Acidobacteria bacterium]|nr:hypothetical protein [Acidobacteriota bacterium]